MTAQQDPLSHLLQSVQEYDNEINRAERAPTGDDYNNLFALITEYRPLAEPVQGPGEPTVYQCPECLWSGTTDEINGIHHLHHIQEHIEPGELVPAGCCPECNAMIGVASRDVPHDTLYIVGRIMRERGWTVAAPAGCPSLDTTSKGA